MAIALALFGASLICFAMEALPFLAITERVEADTMVVEAWMAPYLLKAVADEYHQEHYSRILVAGLLHNQNERHPVPEEASIQRTIDRLEALGIPPDRIIACPAPFAEWRRTAKSARAVKEKLQELGLKPVGVNIATDGTHARESWVAYRNMLGDGIPVGVISIYFRDPPGYHWWLHRTRTFWMIKDFLAWLKEVVLPMHS